MSEELTCPKCSGTMKEFTHEGVTLDFCQSCGASWFDEGEMSRYFLTAKDLPNTSVMIIEFDESGPRCPRDGMLLQKYAYSRDHKLFVDLCPSCRGMLLERGEVATVKMVASEIGQVTKKFFESFNFDSPAS